MKFYLDNTEDIFLYQLLKASGAIEEYAHVRRMIMEGEVKVNKQTVFKQRIRIFPGDEVVYKEMHIKVLAGKSPAERPPKPLVEKREEKVYHGKVQKWKKHPLKKEKNLRSDLDFEAKKLHSHLLSRSLNLALAESCTGGMASQILTSMPGASGYFLGSVVSYSNAVKSEILKVKNSSLKSHGAVSGEVAEEMSAGVREAMGANLSGAITGIAGPEGGEPGKPVGTVYIAVHRDNEKTVKRFQFKGSRDEIRLQSCLELFRLLLKISWWTEHKKDD